MAFLQMPRAPLQAGLLPHMQALLTQAFAVTVSQAVEQSPQCAKSVPTLTHIATFLQQLELAGV